MYAESAGRPYVYRKRLKIGALPSQRVNGGGWSARRPNSALMVRRTTVFPLPALARFNCTNGEDFGSSAFPMPYYGTEGNAEAYSFHPTGMMVVFGDSSTRFVAETISMKEIWPVW